ncbi:MAG: hypothetical protein V1487_02700 [bacterium]
MITSKILKPVILIAIVIVIGYTYLSRNKPAQNTQTISTETGNEQEDVVFNCPYNIDGGIYKDYVRSNGETEVIGRPVFIYNPQTIKLKKPFVIKEFQSTLYRGSKDDWESREFDVDADGKDEMIIFANITMNHTPNISMVVKNGNIIFEAFGGGIWMDEMYGGEGFMLTQEVDRQIGEYEKTRYLYKDGGFMPVWTQKSCYVNFE